MSEMTNVMAALRVLAEDNDILFSPLLAHIEQADAAMRAAWTAWNEGRHIDDDALTDANDRLFALLLPEVDDAEG